MKIMLPVDGSEYTKRMLGYVAAHDELFGSGHVYVAFTVVPRLPPRALSFFDRATIDDYYRDEADRVLNPVRAFAAQKGWSLEASYDYGPAAQTIAERIAMERPDLVVMGTHGHTALAGLVLGSVTTGVLARCRTAVLLVR